MFDRFFKPVYFRKNRFSGVILQPVCTNRLDKVVCTNRLKIKKWFKIKKRLKNVANKKTLLNSFKIKTRLEKTLDDNHLSCVHFHEPRLWLPPKI